VSNQGQSLSDRGEGVNERGLAAIASVGHAGQLPLQRRAILVVEDECLIAEDVAVILKDAGAEVIGPAESLPRGIRLASETEQIDAALLNVFLNGLTVFPLVDALQDRGVPILFLTGYDEGEIPPEYSHIRCCQKPVGAGRIVEEVCNLLQPVVV